MHAGRFVRIMHRVHRGLGSVLALLIAVWFASGAVMSFSGYPSYSEQERLATAPPLPYGAPLALPAALRAHLAAGGLAHGGRVRLAMQEGQPTWLFDAASARAALRATDRPEVTELDAGRAAHEVARRLALPVAEASRMRESDQWTVALARPALLPLFRVQLNDRAGSVAYVTARSGEIVQLSSRRERLLAWLGAIPHWIYPTVLRREGELWENSVLVLAGLGLVLSSSGTLVGLHVWRSTRKRRGIRDAYLRWHQRLGLWFGVFASSWLFSGALSFAPFQWSGEHAPRRHEQAALYAGSLSDAASLQAALHSCQRALRVVELELSAFGGRVYAVCSDAAMHTRLVDLVDPSATLLTSIGAAELRALALQLSAGAAPAPTVDVAHQYDAYHYPTHLRPFAALPFARLSLGDAQGTTFYVDPQRARLIRRYDARTRLERWLYHGLHSLDLPGFYEHSVLWQTTVVAAMFLGFSLSTLGLIMALRRRRRRVSRRRAGLELHGRVVSRQFPRPSEAEVRWSTGQRGARRVWWRRWRRP